MLQLGQEKVDLGCALLEGNGLQELDCVRRLLDLL